MSMGGKGSSFSMARRPTPAQQGGVYGQGQQQPFVVHGSPMQPQQPQQQSGLMDILQQQPQGRPFQAYPNFNLPRPQMTSIAHPNSPVFGGQSGMRPAPSWLGGPQVAPNTAGNSFAPRPISGYLGQPGSAQNPWAILKSSQGQGLW